MVEVVMEVMLVLKVEVEVIASGHCKFLIIV